jgi:hypothetical protein
MIASSLRIPSLAAVAAALVLPIVGCGGSAVKQSFPGTPSSSRTMESSKAEAALASPASPPAQAGGAMADDRAAPSVAAEPEKRDRPGLGTEWGETLSSRITTVSFERADASQPMAVAQVFYNDEEGVREMTERSRFPRSSTDAFSIAGGAVRVALRDQGGGFLSGFTAGSKNLIIGDSGRRYTIVLKNETDRRFECVVSVDGLDVIDGAEASFQKRGYLLDPHAELEIDGFRQSVDEVAAFRFGSVRDSYSNQKHGTTRNVGVIGVALFHERGTDPSRWTDEEIERRNSADPFPGRFATPPAQRAE